MSIRVRSEYLTRLYAVAIAGGFVGLAAGVLLSNLAPGAGRPYTCFTVKPFHEAATWGIVIVGPLAVGLSLGNAAPRIRLIGACALGVAALIGAATLWQAASGHQCTPWP